MAFPESVLDDGEEIVRNLRPQWRRIAWPVALLPIVVGLASYGWFALPDDSARKWLRWVILAAAVIILIWWSLRPQNSIEPSARRRPRSPVRYILCGAAPAPGADRKRSAV